MPGLVGDAVGVGLVLNVVTTALVGLAVWYLKQFISSIRERDETVDFHNRVLTGDNDDSKGVIDVVESHDTELSLAKDDRDYLRRRQKLTERRVDRLYEESDLRNEFSEMQADLRERHQRRIFNDGDENGGEAELGDD